MKKTAILFTLLLLVLSATAQQPDANEYQQQYARLHKNYLQNPDDVYNLYQLASFYSDTNNPMCNLSMAMDYICQAETRYVTMVEDPSQYREAARLVRKKITVSALRQLRQTIVDQAIALLNTTDTNALLTSIQLDNMARSFAQESHVINLIDQQRMIAALHEARQSGQLSDYYSFITRYPGTNESDEVATEMVEKARQLCEDAQWESEVDAIVGPYLNVEGMNRMALKRKSTIAYARATQQHTVEAYRQYLLNYPMGDEYTLAIEQLDSLLTYEYELLHTPQQLADFAIKNDDSQLSQQAINQIKQMITDGHSTVAAEVYLKNFPLDEDYDRIFRLFYEWHLIEGNSNPIRRFQQQFPTFPYQLAVTEDLVAAAKKDDIPLMGRFRESDFSTYTSYIYKLTGRKVSFVALQRTLQQLIANQQWKACLQRIDKFDISFEKDCVDEVAELRAILSTPSDNKKELSTEVLPTYAMTHAQSVHNNQILYYNKITNGTSTIAMARHAVGKNYKWQSIGDVQFTNIKNDGSLTFYQLYADGTRMLLSNLEGDICIAENEGDKWTITDIPTYPVNTDYNDYDAFMLPDGSGMLIASDRPGGFNLQDSRAYFHGDTALASDIYYIPHTARGWGEAINLGQHINTPYCDHSPILSSDMKTLYFITDGHGGLGYGDVYVSTRTDINDWTSWSPAQNYGKEVNSGFDEGTITLSDDGKRLFVCSNKRGSYACYSTAALHRGGAGSYDVKIVPQASMTMTVIDCTNQNIVAEEKVMTTQPLKVPLFGEKDYVVIGKTIDSLYVPSQRIKPSTTHLITLTPLDAVTLFNYGAIALYAVDFEPNSAELVVTAEHELQQVVDFMRSHATCVAELRVNVAGTDDKHCYNLGQERCRTLKTYLIKQGINADRIVTANYGNVNYTTTSPSSGVEIVFSQQ